MGPQGTPLPPFETLITAHGTAVLRVCRAMVGSQDAEDVWQETFIAALRAYPTSADILNREAWLVAIARNKAIDHHRHTGRLPVPAGPFGTEASGSLARNEGDVVVRAVETSEDASLVWEAIGKLPPKQREAVVYHHLAGLRYATVAELLGNSQAAARRAAADGMKALRVLLKTQEGNGQ